MKKSIVLKISLVSLFLASYIVLGNLESKAWGKKCCEPEPVCCDPCARKQVVKKVKIVQPEEEKEEMVVKNEVVTEEIKQDEPVVQETKVEEVEEVKVEKVKSRDTNYFPGLF